MGHRAASSYLSDVENSMEALSHAVLETEGMSYMEFDIQTTKDGIPIVLHDDNTCRVTYKRVDAIETNYKDLPRLINGEKIPTMEDYVYYIMNNLDPSVPIIVDTKRTTPASIAEYTTLVTLLKTRFTVIAGVHEWDVVDVNVDLICKQLDKYEIFKTDTKNACEVV